MMKNRMMFWSAVGLVAGAVRAAPVVEGTASYQKEGVGAAIVSGAADLPAEGLWAVDLAAAEGLAAGAVATPEEAAYRQLEGDRMGEVMLRENINKGRWRLQGLHYSCSQYARTNANTGPASLAQVDTNSWHMRRALETPWEGVPEKRLGGPYFHLVPSVPFEFSQRKGKSVGTATNEVLLAVELRPYLDDGKHWVVYANDVCRREEIDADLMRELGVEIRPVYTRAELFPGEPETFAYTFDMPVRGTVPKAVALPLTNAYTGASMVLDWKLGGAAAGDESIWTRYREARAGEWLAYWNHSQSPVLGAWLVAAGQKKAIAPPRRRRGRRGEDTSIFGVMGGLAAVRETLQTRLITPNTNAVERVVPIGEIEGVKVRSHPYDEMLGDEPGGRLALAELVPDDRFFVYLNKPESMLPLLNEGADFIAELGSARSGNSIRYHLKDRYLKRLGMTEAFLETVLRSGVISECAVTAPDLFFIDGTDITVISRLSEPDKIAPLLRLIGVSGLSEGVREFGSVYWALREDLLVLGTSRGEVEKTLALAADGGGGSLGQSAEFRYMLTKLPTRESTRAYVYLSDPFIRRLVGPEVKIAQLRRAETMIRARHLTAAALLARRDGVEDPCDIDALKARGYLPAAFDAADVSLDDELVARSCCWGSLADQQTIGAAPVTRASVAEAKAYEAYVENYARYWRRFFDPIALRLDDVEDGALEAEVFILPLIDNSIYNSARDALAAGEEGAPLLVPEMDPEPVLRVSVNLNEEAWRGVSEGLGDMLRQFVFVDPAVLDDLGSAVHLMMRDADPVIALGSGDLLGAFGANVMDDDMFFIPMALSVLTRPCVLAVETKNPEKTATYLRNATHSAGSDWEVSSEFYQVGDADQWICLFDLFGMARLRYGLEVRGNYLLIRNIPWSADEKIVSKHEEDLNAMALRVLPGAVKLQLPGLHATAAEKSRAAALRGMGMLYPFMLDGASIEEARAAHMKLFGHAPQVSAADEWAWKNGAMESALYGSVFRKRQPGHEEGDAEFGLLGAIEFLDVSSQFEDSGYRARVRWKTRK